MTDIHTHTFESRGETVTLLFRRSLLSDHRFRTLAARFAHGEDADPMILNVCYLVAHVVDADGSDTLPLRTNASEEDFHLAFDEVLDWFEGYDELSNAMDAIPSRLPKETDPERKHDADLTPDEAAEIDEIKQEEKRTGEKVTRPN